MAHVRSLNWRFFTMPYESDLPTVVDNTKGDKQQSEQESASHKLLQGAYGEAKQSERAKDDQVNIYEHPKMRDPDDGGDSISGKIGMKHDWDSLFNRLKDP